MSDSPLFHFHIIYSFRLGERRKDNLDNQTGDLVFSFS